MIDKALAADWSSKTGFLAKIAGSQGEGSASSLPLIIDRVINVILYIAGALAIIYIIYSGILYITAAGNPDASKKGQQGLVNGAIGLVVIVLAYYLASSIAHYAGTNLGNPTK
jgi:hypothetical protein